MRFLQRLGTHAVTVRPQTNEDQPFLEALYVSHRWEEVQMAAGWTDDQRLAFLRDQYGLQWRHYETHYEGCEFLILEIDDTPVGRLYIFDRHPRELRIVEIGFLPGWRGRGLGGALLRLVQNHARSQGKFCSIHVERDNPARRLYERLGFKEVKPVGPYVLLEWHADTEGRPQLKTA